MEQPRAVADVSRPWHDRRRRAAELRERYSFADEMLRLFEALVDVQEHAFAAVRTHPPTDQDLPRWVSEEVLPEILDATVAHGPRGLAEAVDAYRRPWAGGAGLIADWLRNPGEQSP